VASGRLAIDDSVATDPSRSSYIDLDKQAWPHGASGAAWGHAALFLPADQRRPHPPAVE